MNQSALTHAPAPRVAGVLAWLLLAATIVPSARAAEYFVDNASGSCSTSGPGTPAAPYCTISAALAAHHQPGDVITVRPGTYREQVTVPASGFAGSPITLRAQPGAGAVVIDGTDDFSDPTLWSQASGDVWLAASVTIAPKQVFADDQRLAPSTAPPASLPPRSFTFIAGSGLYVNAGGGNPATHRTQVGTRLRGFFVSGRSYIVVRGFTITRCEDRSIQLTNSSNILVDSNTLTFSGGFGFQASGDSADRVVSNISSNHLGHGFSLINRTVELTIEGNEAFGNADPNVRVANGLFVSGSMRNVIRGNRWHDNQDSGEQFSPAAADNISLENCSWANGDHGFDHNGATGTVHVNDVAVGNFNDGFSIEGHSTGTQVFNAIAIENGTTHNGFDLYVDSLSTAGLQSNDNVLWNSGAQPPVRYARGTYTSVAAYAAAEGQDSRSLQADPRFADAAHGDFHLTAGSPAIDDGNSGVADWPSTDAEGNTRADDPGTPNRGMGPVTFADRGALEFQGSTPVPNQPPVARLTATPPSGTAPLAVKLDASGSSDADGRVASYTFAFGDGATAGPQAAAIANHTYAAGNWTATVTATDDKGATATASASVTVTAPAANQPPVAKLTAAPSSGTAPLNAQLDASGSSDADGRVVSYTFAFGDGATAGPQPTATANHTYAAGNWTATVTAADDKGATATASASVTVTAPVSSNAPPVAALEMRPASGIAPLDVHAFANGSSDSDGHIVSYLFDFGDGTRVGPQHAPQAKHTYAAGHWTARVDVTDDGGATASAFATVDCSGPPSNLVANGSFEGGTSGWSAMGGASLRQVQGGEDGRFSLLVSAPLLGLVGYGAGDQPSALPPGEPVGTHYHVRAWARTELGAGLVSLAVRESNATGASFTTRSSSVVLGTGWVALDADVTTQLAGSSLGVSVVNAPSVLGTAFRIDNVSVLQGTAVALMSLLDDDAPADPPADDPFMASGVHPNPVRAAGARIVFTTSDVGAAQIAIFDLAGRVVRRLAGDPAAPAGAQAVAFDGRGDDGRRLPGGVYYYEVRMPGASTHGRLVIAE